MKKILLSMVAMVFGLACGGTAFAAQHTGSMLVSVNMIPVCNLTIPPLGLEFLDYDGTVDVPGSTDITVNCTAGTTYSIGMGLGLYSLPPYRQLSDGTDFIRYYLYKPDNLNFWTLTQPLSGLTADGTAQPYTVHGKLLKNYGGATGAYEDTVTVELNF